MDSTDQGVERLAVSRKLASLGDTAANFHPVAWLAWLTATLVALSATRNPINLGVILFCIGLALRMARAQAYAPLLPLSPWRFAVIVVTMSALFNALTAHFGATALLVLPAWLPLLGGPVTLEALIYGALNGLVLAGFFAAFTVLYLALPIQAVIRLIPRAFYPVGVVMSVSLAFVPSTLAQFQQIRAAQTLRGHRVRGLRDWLPLFMPLLVGGLERALQLAEAMTARGFAPASPAPAGLRTRTLPRLLLLAGLATLLAGLVVRLLDQPAVLSSATLVTGALLVILALWWQGRRVRRTTYRPQPWLAHDWIMTLAAALACGAYLLATPLGRRAALAYTPYPQLSWPPLDPWMILATLGLLAPALLGRPRWRQQE